MPAVIELLNLPPVDVVQTLGAYLDGGDPQHVLDAGSGSGRNSLYLAEQGHSVLGITNDADEVLAAEKLAAQRGVAGRCTFKLGDICTAQLPGQYNVVLNNEVLHLMPPPYAGMMLQRLRRQTAPGGLHAVSGYMADSAVTHPKNRERCLRSGQLADLYERAGWVVLHYQEQILPVRHSGGREIISSRARLIARR